MKILLTGAFGNVGESTLDYLVERNHEITCFDKKTLSNIKTARPFKKKVKKIIWSDIRKQDAVEKAVKGQDMVIHLAAVIPPKADKSKKYTSNVNAGGTLNIVNAIKNQLTPPKLIYSSSVAVYGDVRTKHSPIIREDEPPSVTEGDHYATSKLKAEEFIKHLDTDWVIFRLSYIPNPKRISLTPLMFRMPLDTPMEFTHTKDCGLALANAVDSKEIWGKIYNLGGGEGCQLYYKDFLAKMLPQMGVELLPDEAFSNEPFHCCYYDTKELEKILNFQKHDLNDLLKEMVENAKYKSVLARIFKPLVRPILLSLSPYYKKRKKSDLK